jgi:hypothetical protein
MNADKRGSEKPEGVSNRKMIRTILLLVVHRPFLSAFLRVHPRLILLARAAAKLSLSTSAFAHVFRAMSPVRDAMFIDPDAP